MRSKISLLASLVLALGCSPGTSPMHADAGGDDAGPGDAARSDVGPRDAGPPPPTPTGTFPTHPRTLPFPYTRPDVGTPLSATELADATDHYLALLDRVHWFDYVEQRAHGWPESAPG